MRVVVDTDRCQDHGQCCFAAPEVFELDDEGHLVVPTTEPDESSRQRVEEAADLCPMQAITLED